MKKEIKTAYWQCRICGNTYTTEMKQGEEIKKPSFCECKHRNYELVQDKCEFYDQPEEIKKETKEYEFVGSTGNPFKGRKEYVEFNLNQGIFNGHFYYSKLLDIDGQLVESVAFDDGSTATNWEKFLVNQVVVDKKGNEVQKMLPYGKNQIKKIGMTYRYGIIPQKNDWSNRSIDVFCNKMSRLYKESVGSVDSVDVYIDRMEFATGRAVQADLSHNNKKDTLLYYILCSLKLPTLTTHLALKDYLLKTIINVQDIYMDVVDKRSFLLTTAFIISSYCYSLFDATGYLFFNSDKESGKTKFATVLSLMCFHSINCTSPSEAALFRITSLGMGTMLIDDFERISEEKKNTLLQILKVGYRKDGKVIRVEKRKNLFVPQIFDCYCPKMVTNTSSLEPVTLSRCIPIHLMKTLTGKGRLWPKENEGGWQVIRDMCHLFVMRNWRRIKAIYDDYECDRLNNRDLELVKGYLAVMQFIDGALHDQLLDYLVECFKDRETVDMTGTWIYVLCDMLLGKVSVEGCWLKAKDIADNLRGKIVSDAGCDDEKDFKAKKGQKLPTVRYVGGTLSKIPSFKKRRVGAGVEYWLSKKLVEDYMKIKGFYLEKTEQKTLKNNNNNNDVGD